MPVQKTDNSSSSFILTQEQKKMLLDEITQISERIVKMSSRVLVLENNNANTEQNNTNIRQELLLAERNIKKIHEDIHELNLETESHSGSISKLSQEIAQCKLDQENVQKLSKEITDEQLEIKTDQNRLLQEYKESNNNLENTKQNLEEIDKKAAKEEAHMKSLSLDFDDILTDQQQLLSDFKKISKNQQQLLSEFEEVRSGRHPLMVRFKKHSQDQQKLFLEFEEIISGRHPLIVSFEKHSQHQQRLLSKFKELASERQPVRVSFDNHSQDQQQPIDEIFPAQNDNDVREFIAGGTSNKEHTKFDTSKTRFYHLGMNGQLVTSQPPSQAFSPFYEVDHVYSNTACSLATTKKINDQIDESVVITFFETYKTLAAEVQTILEKSESYLKKIKDDVEDSFRVALFKESDSTHLQYSRKAEQLKEIKAYDESVISEGLATPQQVNDPHGLKSEGHPLHSLLDKSLSLEKFYKEIYLKIIALESTIQNKNNRSFIDLSIEIKEWYRGISSIIKDIKTALEDEKLTSLEIKEKKLHYDEIIMQMSLSKNDYITRLSEFENENADQYNETPSIEPSIIVEETVLAVSSNNIPLHQKIKQVFLNFFSYINCFIRKRDLSSYDAKEIKIQPSVDVPK